MVLKKCLGFISFLSRCEIFITDMSQVRLLLLSVAALLHQCKKGYLGDIRFFAEECLYHSLQKEWKYCVRVEANLFPFDNSIERFQIGWTG